MSTKKRTTPWESLEALGFPREIPGLGTCRSWDWDWTQNREYGATEPGTQGEWHIGWYIPLGTYLGEVFILGGQEIPSLSLALAAISWWSYYHYLLNQYLDTNTIGKIVRGLT